MVRIAHERHVNAPPAQVFAVVADDERMPEWFPAREVLRRRPGSPQPDGVGAARVVRSAGLAAEEIVTVFEPGERLAWRLEAGLPGSFRIARRVLARRVSRALEGLARRCEAD